MPEKLPEITRRTLLKKVIKSFFLILSFFSISLFSLFAYPWKMRHKKTVFYFACEEYKLPLRGVKQFYITYAMNEKKVQFKVFIVNTGTELFALSPVCTHLGCLVNWHRNKERFLCPCHGGEYDMNGNVLEGPPPAPMNRLPLKIEKEKAFIGLRV